jgi:hypothetical protein
MAFSSPNKVVKFFTSNSHFPYQEEKIKTERIVTHRKVKVDFHFVKKNFPFFKDKKSERRLGKIINLL